MNPSRILLVRHGESQSNVDKGILRTVPNYALSLTDRGRAQAYDTGLKIKELYGDSPAFFYVSPFWRTRQTFEEIVKNVPMESFKEDPRIREQEIINTFDGDLSSVKKRFEYGNFYFRHPYAESPADVFNRVTAFIESMIRDFEHNQMQNCIIVTHAVTMRIFVMCMLGLTVEEYESMEKPDNCDIWEFRANTLGKFSLATNIPKTNRIPPFSYKRPENWCCGWPMWDVTEDDVAALGQKDYFCQMCENQKTI